MKKSLFLLFFLLQVWIVEADSFYCKTIGVEEGLTQSSVTCMMYDGYGSLWIGTRFGLNEYRNGRINTFLDEGNEGDEGARGNYINLLFCDSGKNLWVSTDKGLFRYDRSGEEFILYDEKPVLSAAEAGGMIFFGGHEGIVSYDPSKDSLTPGEAEAYTDIIDVYAYGGGIIYIDRKYGLYKRSGQKTLHLDIPETGGNLIMDSALHGDTLYLSVLNVGLVSVDLGGAGKTAIFPPGHNGLPAEVILSLLVVDGALWIGTDGGGVIIFNLESGIFSNIEDVSHLQSGKHIPISVTTLYRDPMNNLWIGSVRSGAMGLKPSSIKSFAHLGRDRNSDNGSVVIWLLDSEDGHIYIGTDGSGVYRYDQVSGHISTFPGHMGKKVTSIADFDASSLLVSIYNQGFFLMDRKNGSLRPFILSDRTTNAEECLNSNAPTIFNNQDGTLLLLAVNTFSYDKAKRTFTRFTDETMEEGKELRVIAPAYGSVLYAYSSAGLFTIDRDMRKINILLRADVHSGNINTAVCHGGRIFYGTNYGLYSYDPVTGAKERLAAGFFNRVTTLAFTRDGKLWIAADNSLFLYHDGVVAMTGENRGVPANEILASVEGANGSIYFGGTTGFLEVGGFLSADAELPKNIELHNVAVTGRKVPLSSGPLEVRHNYSSIVLTVNIVGADPFDKKMYRYSVNGENGFTVDTYEDNLSLPALKPGLYKVDASYLMSNGEWSAPESVLGIRVRPPWYGSAVMIAIYVLIGLLIIALIIRTLNKHAMNRMEAELRERDILFTTKLGECININLADNSLSASKLATQMAMSRASLYYKVNSAFGKGVAELIEERRMGRAEELLASTSLSVLDISEKVGYSTPRYFSTRFKQLHDGMTPLKYRQKHRA